MPYFTIVKRFVEGPPPRLVLKVSPPLALKPQEVFNWSRVFASEREKKIGGT
jgi:hypothetical protein